MIGIVRTVRVIEETDGESGIRIARYEISGEDFHTVLNTNVYLNAALKSFADGSGTPVIADAFLLTTRSRAIWRPTYNYKKSY